MAEKGQPLPKFGEWDVNDPASAEGFTVIFNKARNEKKTGGKPDSPAKDHSTFKPGATATPGKPQTVSNNLAYSILICFSIWLNAHSCVMVEAFSYHSSPHQSHVFMHELGYVFASLSIVDSNLF